jgi:hypothetical protein
MLELLTEVKVLRFSIDGINFKKEVTPNTSLIAIAGHIAFFDDTLLMIYFTA